MHPRDKEKIVLEVTQRVLEGLQGRSVGRKEAYLDNVISEVFYHENRRIETDRTSAFIAEDRVWLAGLRERFKNASESDKLKILESIIDRHANEVVGHFSETTYRISTKMLPMGLGIMLNGMSPLKLLKGLPKLPSAAGHLEVEGEIEQFQALNKLGTPILVPTHSSNFDSIAVGFSIYEAGLPPFTYGAGLNLFNNKFLGFFMQRLGAYKVDRRKKHKLYKDVLKEYATRTIEMGYPNLFFPGGTRSRSGAVEQKLKLGLMGCGIRAYGNNLRAGRKKPNVYIIPCTLNYQLVLEAETLIEDHLKAAGKSRYIIEDDEFSKFERMYSFMKNLVSLDAGVTVRIGRALDPFGNEVDMEGRSVDGSGRTIDTSRYLMRDGKVVADAGRDAQYTTELGDAVVDAFMRDSVIASTHILAWSVFEYLRRKHPDPDFYRFLRLSAYQASIPMIDIYREVEQTLKAVRAMEGQDRLKLALTPRSKDAEEVVNRALRFFGCYHTHHAVERRGDRLFPTDMNLIYYYRNRLWGYGLDQVN